MNRSSNIPRLCLILLLVAGFGAGARLSTHHEDWIGPERQNEDLLTFLLGDSRRLFANQFFTKADEYFHSGYYPSIFDNRENFADAKVATEATTGESEDDHESHIWLSEESTDWIDRFSRHFYPSEHMHLGEDDHNHSHAHDDHAHDDHDHAHGPPPESEVAEILPWLQITAKLDPNKVETYVTASYWLRKRMGRPDEAEAFLRDGLRENPGSYEILFELGRIKWEERRQPDLARNLFKLSLRRWIESEEAKPADQRDHFVLAQILGQLARLEETEGDPDAAIAVLEQLKTIAPNPAGVQERIDVLKSSPRP